MASLIHRWQLTENGNDSIGNLHFTNKNGVTFGVTGATFDLSSKWLEVTYSISVPFAFTVWAKPNNYTGDLMAIIGGYPASTAWGLCVAQYITGGYYRISTRDNFKDISATITSNVEKMISFIGHADGTVTLYSGETLLGTTAAISGLSATKLLVGATSAGSSWPYSGTIRDLRSYSDDNLTVSEIGALVAAGPNPSATQRRPVQIFKTAYMTSIAGRGW